MTVPTRVALCLIGLSPWTRALSVPPRRAPPSRRPILRRPRPDTARGPRAGRPSFQRAPAEASWDDYDDLSWEGAPPAPPVQAEASGDMLFGVNPVLAALQQRRRRMQYAPACFENPVGSQ
jgi:hypothetical protein